MLTVGSVCSGIAAPETAWRGLPFEPLWFAEIDPFPSAVLAHRYPQVPNHGDFTALLRPENRPADVDVLVGGTPCQAFSVAGLRGGLTDPRGNLALAFVALVDVLRPRWVLWENVPGVLSSGGGRDFGAFLGALGHIGYGFAYRVLDAQYFGLAQRRKRVFVVASPGDWRGPAAVLLEPESVRWDSPPRRRSRTGVAGSVTARLGSCGADDNAGQARHIVAAGVPDGDDAGEPVVIQDCRPRDKAQNGRGWSDDGVSYTVDTANTQAVAYNVHGGNANAKERHAYQTDVARCIDRTGGFAPNQGGTVVSVDLQNTAIGGDVAGTLDTTRPGRGGGQAVMAIGLTEDRETARSLNAHPTWMDLDTETFIAHTLRAEGHDASEDGTGRGVPLVPVAFAVQESEYGTMLTDAAGSLRADRESGGTYALTPVAMAVQEDKQNGVTVRDTAGSLRSDAPGSQVGGTLAMERFGVRRLTPTEMERLQGFPDGWTLVPYRNGMASDGPRAKALGNSMAVPVLRWIGERMIAVDAARSPSTR